MAEDSITVLHCAPQLRLAKLIKRDGSTLDYDSPRLFSGIEHPVSSLSGLYSGLQKLKDEPRQCLIRGALIGGPAAHKIRRLLHPDPKTGDGPTLREVPRRWLALDMDGVDRPVGIEPADLLGCARSVIPDLPEGFHRASCVVQASAGHGRKPGSRLRLWYWLARAVDRSQLEVWFAGCKVDPVSFRAAQVIYTAAPVFEDDMSDHLPQRLSLLVGDGDVVVPSADALTLPARPRQQYRPAAFGASWVDKAFERGVAMVASAPIDNRHETCVRVSFNLACLVHDGGLIESEVRAALGAALEHAGKSQEEAFKVFDWAMGQASGRAA